MDQSWQSTRTGSLASSPLAGSAAQAVAGTARTIARVVGQRSRSLRVPGSSLDRRAGGDRDQTRVWRERSSDPLQSSPQSDQAQCPETGKPGQPARCAGNPDVARTTSGRVKKKAEEEERPLVFGDESACSLLPLAVRTYAPVGQTPILTVPLTRDHLSAIGGLTPDGRMFMRFQDHSYKGPDVVRFLQMLSRKSPGKLLVIWEALPFIARMSSKTF
jgi:hypothetical protein